MKKNAGAEEKTLDKKGDKLTDSDRVFGHWPLLCNDLGVCSERQKQTVDRRTHNVCHDSSVTVFNTDCNGMRHISKTNGERERWIFSIESIHWCATVPATFTVVNICLLYTSPSPRDGLLSRMPSSA